MDAAKEIFGRESMLETIIQKQLEERVINQVKTELNFAQRELEMM